MNYYLGIQVIHKEYNEIMRECGGTGHILFTFADCNDSNVVNENLKLYDDSFKIIIDSGAFSLWNTGKSVDRQKLLTFYKGIKTNKEIHFINLDVIPAKRGRKPTKKEAKIACEQGWQNYLWFKKNGIQTLPVFHQDDDFDYLYKIMKENVYFCVSPANDSSTKVRMKWLDSVFAIIKADYKTHGLAATSKQMLERYPFYSVDSINWKSPHMFGNSKAFDKKVNVSLMIKSKSMIKMILKKEIEYYVKLQRDITKLWKSRGVVWK